MENNFICPSCSTDIKSTIRTHFNESNRCKPLELTEKQRDIIRGLMFTHSEIVDSASGLRVRFTTQNQEFGEWIRENLEEVTDNYFSVEDGNTWVSHPISVINGINGKWVQDGEITIPESVPITKDVMRTIYADVGEIGLSQVKPRPVFAVSDCVADSSDFTHLLRYFHPLEMESVEGKSKVYVHQTKEFFQFLGSAVPGCQNQWLSLPDEAVDSAHTPLI